MPDSDTTHTADSALVIIGKRLAKAREEAGKDLGEVASELHLRVEIIQALEAGDENILPAAAFVRGYVRSYARYVGLDDVALVASLPQAVEHRPVPRQTARKPYRVPSVTFGRLLVWALVLLVLTVLVLYGPPAVERLLSGQDSQLSSSTLQLPPGDIQTPDVNVLPLPAIENDGSSATKGNTPGDDTASRSAVSPSSPAEETPAAAPEATGPAQLTLRFTQDSWVEMTSRERKLVIGTQHAGTERTVRAEPPINILLGNAPGVKMFWRGKPFDITPYQRGKVARIKLEH